MPGVQPCVPTSCCSTPQSVDIPGPEGIPGIDGTNGYNAFSVTTADFVIPAAGSNVTVPVDQSLWMVVGQLVVATGPATFQVISIPTATSVELQYLDYPYDVGAGNTVASGSGISPAGAIASQSLSSVDADGTAYTLTATPALLDFGTTDPQLTINAAGTWLLFVRVRVDYNGATFAARRTVTIKIRRTNNTAADVASDSFDTELITTQSFIAGTVHLVAIPYLTANSNDALEVWGDVSVVPSAGSIDAVEASFVALKLA